MKKSRKIYSGFQLASAILMIMLLSWLTISTPFVFASQQEQVKQGKIINLADSNAGCEEENANPFGNNTEEKTPTGNSLSEEYLHTFHITSHFYTAVSLYHKIENPDIYIAFHGELLVPPPNAA